MIKIDQAESMVTMLDAGWTLAAIGAHFGVDVKEVERRIVQHVKRDREESTANRRNK
jgi:hypothetical protein